MWLCSAFIGVREDWAEDSLHAIVCAPSHHQRWELQQFQSTKEVMDRFCFRGRWCIHCFVCQIIARIIKRIWIRLILHVWTRFCSTNLFWLPDQMPRHIVNLNRGEAISPCFEVWRSGWWIVRLHLHAIRFFSTAIWYEGRQPSPSYQIAGTESSINTIPRTRGRSLHYLKQWVTYVTPSLWWQEKSDINAVNSSHSSQRHKALSQRSSRTKQKSQPRFSSLPVSTCVPITSAKLSPQCITIAGECDGFPEGRRHLSPHTRECLYK